MDSVSLHTTQNRNYALDRGLRTVHIDDKIHFQRNPDYIYREVAGEAVLIPTGKAAEYFFGIASINSTGVFIWKALEQERSFGELKEMFAREYELEDEQSRQDLTEFIEAALSRNMVLQC